MHLNVLPAACRLGVAIATRLRVERVANDRGKATGVVARRPDGSKVRLAARRVIVSAGALETPPLLRRSGLGKHPGVGRGLSIHPAIGVSGTFAEEVFAWRGVLQSAGVEEFHHERGILIEARATPPGMGSMITPGYGPSLVRRIGESSHVATIGAMIADAPSGRVLGRRRPTTVYGLARRDAERLREAIGAMARILLAAGAEEVELGAGAPPVRAEGELSDALEKVHPKRMHLAAFHPTGSVAAGGDSRRHPVGPEGALRGIDGVWVADGSIVPGCPGVNPQISIMALSAAVGAAAAR